MRMRLDIRTAALDDDAEHRVALAVPLLMAYELRVSPWDGTRCDLLVAAADDAYGCRALALALRRGTPVIALGEPSEYLDVEPLAKDTSVSSLTRAIRARLQAPTNGPRPHSPTTSKLVLCQLAETPMRGKAVDVQHNARSLMLRPEFGRVYAANYSDFLAGTESLHEPQWKLAPAGQLAPTLGMFSASLESFLLQAAYNKPDDLPEFPNGRYRLDAWPDLGSLPALVVALRIAKQLIGGPNTPEQLVKSEHRQSNRAGVNACLWALAAANLLINADEHPRSLSLQTRPSERHIDVPIWSRIARRFGLLPR